MYQRCFDNASETLFVAGKTPRLSRFAFSDDPKWESGHHVHDNETELIYVKKGVARFTIDSSLYVAHADDIVVIERGRLHAVASDVNDPATTCTCALYGFQFQGAEENQLLQPHSCPVIAAGQGKEVIKTLFNELSVILPQSKNSQTSSLWDAFAYTLAILYYENFKNAYRSEQGYIKKDVLIKDILFYLNNNYREKITLEQLSKKFRASVSYICHEFTKEYRISPINYVIQRRMTEGNGHSLILNYHRQRSPGVWVMKMSITLPNCFCAMSVVRPAITAGNLKTVLRNKKSYLNFLNR